MGGSDKTVPGVDDLSCVRGAAVAWEVKGIQDGKGTRGLHSRALLSSSGTPASS